MLSNSTIIKGLILFVFPFSIAYGQHEKISTDQYKAPEDPLVRKNLETWHGLKFGLFIHWGPYSQWGVVESWTLCPEDRDFIKRTGPYGHDWYQYKIAYEKLGQTFNPKNFDPSRWAAAAENAGMRYMVFTTKHHDGFCMYDTKETDYKITSPSGAFYKNTKIDITKEIFSAFRDKGFMIGAYFSKPDWHSQDFWWSYFPPKDRNASYDVTKYPERWQRFRDFSYRQVEELMKNYGKVDVLWFDGSWVRPAIQNQDLNMANIARMARSHQPGILFVDRKGPAELENYLTPEQEVPESFIPIPWETCMTLGESWSYKPNDQYKSARSVLHTLVDIVAKNGNLLLNIGPDQNGDWDPKAKACLEQIGSWMKVNHEALYESRPLAPYRHGKWAFTQKNNVYYAFYLPSEDEQILPERLLLPDGIVGNNDVLTLLGNSRKIDHSVNSSGGTNLNLPSSFRRATSGQPVYVFKIVSKVSKT
ncbi:alpha-L-fucosidase [Parapedobacter deserti]|uniref:alpha-L-fucosidase n=1 Tax=Parapedobacter deserti TaxID=1912957 RepID=A0ABV7JLK7_9SPHI